MSQYEKMASLKELPPTASEGDLCKYDGQPYVYVKGQWITLHESARMVIAEQKEKL
jgi:hypothetical protein